MTIANQRKDEGADIRRGTSRYASGCLAKFSKNSDKQVLPKIPWPAFRAQSVF